MGLSDDEDRQRNNSRRMTEGRRISHDRTDDQPDAGLLDRSGPFWRRPINCSFLRTGAATTVVGDSLQRPAALPAMTRACEGADRAVRDRLCRRSGPHHNGNRKCRAATLALPLPPNLKTFHAARLHGPRFARTKGGRGPTHGEVSGRRAVFQRQATTWRLLGPHKTRGARLDERHRQNDVRSGPSQQCEIARISIKFPPKAPETAASQLIGDGIFCRILVIRII